MPAAGPAGYIHSMPTPWPDSIKELSIHLAGVKGTGMCALAEILTAAGALLSGSDVDEVFYTDAILAELGVPVRPFAAESLGDAQLLVRSAAYGEENPVVEAAMDAGLPIFTYPEALGAISRGFDASGIAGVHGKTTTTALAGSLLRALESPSTVVVGSAVSGFGDRSTWSGGSDYLVAETCEYRRHFLHFAPHRIVLTSVEPDHQDYYPDYQSIRTAFLEYIASLPPGGQLIYCADDAGAAETAASAAADRPDLVLIPYGESAPGPWNVAFAAPAAGENRFRVAAFGNEFTLKVPGRHVVLDAAAALALAWSLENNRRGGGGESPAGNPRAEDFAARCAGALAEFRGSRRRSEIIGEAGGILFMDDYAHHPTAIAATLGGLKEFHPDRRLVVNFQSHTYSRTAALFNDFIRSFPAADVLTLQPIYASARETDTGGITGESFAEAAAAQRGGRMTLYCESLEAAADSLRRILRPGDLFITLGAGNNRPLALDLFAEYEENA